MNVDERAEELSRAEQRLVNAEQRRHAAEEELASPIPESFRTRLTGRRGAEARAAIDLEHRQRSAGLDAASGRENAALQEVAEARHHLQKAQGFAETLRELQARQQRRDSWIADHPDELRFEHQLASRIEELLDERPKDARARLAREATSELAPTRLPRRSADAKLREEQSAVAEGAAREAKAGEQALRQTWRVDDRDYIATPQQRPEIRGPRIGM